MFGQEIEFVGGGPLDGDRRRYSGEPPARVRIPIVSYAHVARVARELHEHPERIQEVDVWLYEYVEDALPMLNGLLPALPRYVFRGIERVEATP